MNDLPRTPEGRLTRRARELAIPKLTIRAAAARIGMSPEQWGYAERGYVPRRGTAPEREFHPPADTMARMMHALGNVTPKQLAEDGERPDAAEILREIERRASADTAALGELLAEAADEDDDLREIAEAARLSPELRMAFITLARAMKAAREEQSASG